MWNSPQMFSKKLTAIFSAFALPAAMISRLLYLSMPTRVRYLSYKERSALQLAVNISKVLWPEFEPNCIRYATYWLPYAHFEKMQGTPFHATE